ncbi:MAG: diguanylate cyclase, partial [Alphaproteobacteria bacterium]
GTDAGCPGLRMSKRSDNIMIRLANALLATAPVATATPLHGRLLRGGYHGPMVHSGTEALEEVGRSLPDIVVIGQTLTDMDGLTLARRLKSDPVTGKIPLFLIADRETEAQSRDILEIGIDDVMALPVEDAVLFARMRPLVRIATMHTELQLRATVARQYAVSARDTVSPPAVDTPEVLLAVAGPEDAAYLREAMGDGTDLTVTDDLYEAEGLLSERNYDAAVLFSQGQTASHLNLCAQIRNNSRLFNLPVVLVANPGDSALQTSAYRYGASRLLLRPVPRELMRSAVVPLVRRQRLRWTIRQALTETMVPATRDDRTDLYGRDFLQAYLTDRMVLSQGSDRHVSMILFYVPSVAGIQDNFGEEAAGHLLRKLGQWITGLLRAEDFAARLGGHEFCVILPDTPLGEAEIVMNRIAGVLSHTDFAVPDVYEVVQVWMQVAATEVGPDDTPDSLIARARGKLL